ncbi:hypothetical protein AVEN_41301-1 [Araneus ventricosus]|uniref:Uncharacterized protein n=1 Tax=Araneus ventricosus TaxID=182803 RepID=A0A4Y2T3F1_ARAVE|nr:hypothetical protein AVEN_41301-1 [Araneus ventricosus]
MGSNTRRRFENQCPITNPVLDKRRPKGKSAKGSTNRILEQSFLPPAIPTNYKLTTSTQPPDPSFSPKKSLKEEKDQRLSSSYRPISLLPTIGKVLEKLMTQMLTYHLESTNSLNDRQQREGKSLDTAINELLSEIQTARRDGKVCLSALY